MRRTSEPRLKGTSWPAGCPSENEHPNGSGALQQFARGAIAWSPAVGPAATLAVIDNGRNTRGQNVTLKWDHMGTHWDFYIVRVVVTSRDGNKIRQRDVARTTPWSGQFTVNTRDVMDIGFTSSHSRRRSEMTFWLKGCDNGTFGSDCGPWSDAVTYTWR
ncbi:hypothetical protein ACWDLG_26100 [Nonomuraea sp. NPDC003727]